LHYLFVLSVQKTFGMLVPCAKSSVHETLGDFFCIKGKRFESIASVCFNQWTMEHISENEETPEQKIIPEKEEPETKKRTVTKAVKRKLDLGMTSEELMSRLDRQLSQKWIPMSATILESLMEKELNEAPKLRPLWMEMDLQNLDSISYNAFLKKAISSAKSSTTLWTSDLVALLICCLNGVLEEHKKKTSNELSSQSTTMAPNHISTSSMTANGHLQIESVGASTSQYAHGITQFIRPMSGARKTGLNLSSIYVKTENGSVTAKAPTKSGLNQLDAKGQPVKNFTVDVTIYPTNVIQGIRKQDRWRYATTSISHAVPESDLQYQQILTWAQQVEGYIMSHPEREIKDPGQQQKTSRRS
jgi:hypothetical protein